MPAQLVWLCNPMDCSLADSSVHGIFQARILEWVAISYSGDLHHSGIKPMFPLSPPLAGRFFITTSPEKPMLPESTLSFMPSIFSIDRGFRFPKIDKLQVPVTEWNNEHLTFCVMGFELLPMYTLPRTPGSLPQETLPASIWLSIVLDNKNIVIVIISSIYLC